MERACHSMTTDSTWSRRGSSSPVCDFASHDGPYVQIDRPCHRERQYRSDQGTAPSQSGGEPDGDSGGDKLGRDAPNLHSGKGFDPPAAACRSCGRNETPRPSGVDGRALKIASSRGLMNSIPAVESFPISKRAIWVMCLVLTPLCGAVLYYVWRKDNLPAANYANRVSWISWVAWLVVGFALRAATHRT